MGLTGSHWVGLPEGIAPEMRRYHQQVSRFSAAFAFLSDVSMIVLGGGLKRREKLSARLGDILSAMYLVSCTLKRYEDEGRQAADAPLAHWAIWDAMFRAQNAFEGVISNYPSRAVAWLLRRVIFPLGRPYVVPADRLGHEVARLLIEGSATRDRLTAGMFIPRDESDAVGTVEAALAAVSDAEPIEQKIRAAQRAQQLVTDDGPAAIEEALRSGILSRGEAEKLARARQLVERVIKVDDFDQDFGLSEALRSSEQAGDAVPA